MNRLRAAVSLTVFSVCSAAGMAQISITPQTMKVVGEVDPRFVSYNVEMVEVTGGRFWAPYKQTAQNTPAAADSDKNQPGGLDPNLFRYRSPIDLSNPRLRKLAAALGPAYLRVSGTWRNATYFQDDDNPPLKTPPEGFSGVLTRAEWKGVVDFAHAVNADLVTSVATSLGTRDANGVWTPTHAKAWFDYTRRIGGRVAMSEFMNEPNYLSLAGTPTGYDAAAFGRDAKIFGEFLRRESPGTVYLGPGSSMEGMPLHAPPGQGPKMTSSELLLKASGPVFDAFSYHVYSGVSRRCRSTTRVEDLLTPAWLDGHLAVEAYYAKLRDTYLPGKDMWLTETGEAACGGDPWAAQFVDTFRLLDQLGSLARRSVKSVMINTLASSDYGLLNEETLDPRPNYWAALLWKRLMGTRALDSGPSPNSSLRIYGQCMKDSSGGVSLLIINTDKTADSELKLPVSGERYTLSAPDLLSSTVLLNGTELKAGPDGSLPDLKGQRFNAGSIRLPPVSSTFLTMPAAHNPGCSR